MTDMIDGTYNGEDDSLQGRYLTFALGKTVYGVSIRFVIEIIGVPNITRVPKTPDFIKGIINLRGKIIPLIDVRLKFGKEGLSYTERTCVIVIDHGQMTVGLIVDKVDDVLAIPDELITDAKDERVGFECRYIEGVGNVGGREFLLLDLERFLMADEADAAVRTAASSAAPVGEG
jgi:purine-binding chemotaxis protein CheW